MKISPRSAVLPLLFIASGLALSSFAQGTLTPPAGAPAPTMKSLDQIEARTIVNATNTPGDATNTFIIRAPGSYYFTGNITGAAGKHGISIQANDVTLDLNGFALISGGSGAVRGINVPVAQSGLSVRNGSVRGWSDGGVRADTAVTFAEKLTFAGNVGSFTYTGNVDMPGLAVGNGSLVKDCVAWGNGTGFSGGDRTQFSTCISTENAGDGFLCASYVALTDCTSSRNGINGIGMASNCLVTRCTVSRNMFTGINGVGGYVIEDCAVSSNALDGINAGGGGGIIRNCTFNANGRNGITIDGACQVVGNTCSLNGEDGIRVQYLDINAAGPVVDGNLCAGNIGRGFYLQGLHFLLVRNRASGNGQNYYSSQSWVGGAPNVILTQAGDVATASPWANFTY